MRPSVPTPLILDAAAGLIAERGFDDVTMEAIARAAGVAKGVLYLRYPGKNDLLRAIVRRELALATRRTRELVETDPRGGMLSRVFVHSVTALHSRPALVRFYRDQSGQLARLIRARTGADTSRIVLGAALLRELQDVGLVTTALDPDVFAANLTVWSQGLTLRTPSVDVDTLVLGMGELIARAADTDASDASAGVRVFSRFADALIAELESP